MCTTGQSISPITAALAPAAAAATAACNLEEARVVDGHVAGLDREPGAPELFVANRNVASCVRLDFGAVYDATTVSVTARASSSACGRSPCDMASGCGSGRTLDVFTSVSIEETNAAFVNAMTIGTAFVTRPLEVEGLLRYVWVCRQGTSPMADDVEVDGVIATCR
jgi:hypothetical protein